MEEFDLQWGLDPTGEFSKDLAMKTYYSGMKSIVQRCKNGSSNNNAGNIIEKEMIQVEKDLYTSRN